jgi:hypothetical protein
MEQKLHIHYLCTAKRLDMLCQFLVEEFSWESGAVLIDVLRNGCYAKWMEQQFHSSDLMFEILVIRMAGILRLRYFEDQIMPLMEANKGNLDLLYVGFLSLAMMGNRDSIVGLCAKQDYSKALSYRCLKEIFSRLHRG